MSRTFIPHTCHASIGVFGVVSVASAYLVPGSVADGLAQVPQGDNVALSVEHPTGEFTVELRRDNGVMTGSGLLRTARSLFDGIVCIQDACSVLLSPSDHFLPAAMEHVETYKSERPLCLSRVLAANLFITTPVTAQPLHLINKDRKMTNIDAIDYEKSAATWLKRSAGKLAHAESRALDHLVRGEAIARDPITMLEERTTLGERMADRTAAFGGSWRFIMLFTAVLVAWAAVNSEVLGAHAFDPYPYIFLNLILSMLAAIQAPIIMMSQNRVSTRDRHMAEHDYEVNLKAELEIMALHEKIDALRTQQLEDIVTQQQRQIDLLMELTASLNIRNQTPG